MEVEDSGERGDKFPENKAPQPKTLLSLIRFHQKQTLRFSHRRIPGERHLLSEGAKEAELAERKAEGRCGWKSGELGSWDGPSEAALTEEKLR